jgi:hypothetical protein
MQAEQKAPRQREMLITKPLALVRTGPKKELIAAAQSGKPTMTPESENEAGIDVLAGGNRSGIGGGTPGMAVVATVTPGTAGSTTEGAESVTPATEGSEPKSGTQPDPNAPATSGAPTDNAPAAGTGDAAPKTDAAAGTAPGTDAAKADAAQTPDGTQSGPNADKKKESTSKKKKGIKKILPW